MSVCKSCASNRSHELRDFAFQRDSQPHQRREARHLHADLQVTHEARGHVRRFRERLELAMRDLRLHAAAPAARRSARIFGSQSLASTKSSTAYARNGTDATSLAASHRAHHSGRQSAWRSSPRFASCTIHVPTRRAFATTLTIGFSPSPVGMKLESTTNTFGTP